MKILIYHAQFRVLGYSQASSRQKKEDRKKNLYSLDIFDLQLESSQDLESNQKILAESVSKKLLKQQDEKQMNDLAFQLPDWRMMYQQFLIEVTTVSSAIQPLFIKQMELL